MKTLCTLLFLSLVVHPNGPEKPGRDLTADEVKKLERLQDELFEHVDAGKFEAALKTAQRIADYRARRQPHDHWQVISARFMAQKWKRPAKQCGELARGLAIVQEGQGLVASFHYRKAEAKLRQALAVFQRILGEQHPDTAMSYNNVAVSLEFQGKYADALVYYRKGLAIHQKTLGEKHPDTATSYNEVANSLYLLGKYETSLPLFRKALGIRRTALGDHDRDTASSYNNVAACLTELARHEEALPLFRRALAMRRNELGEQHTDTAASYGNLASCLSKLGQRAEALPLFRKSLSILTTVHGKQHRDTATAYVNVAGCLHSLGRYGEALPLFREGLALRRSVLGEEHVDTAGSYHNVASCLQNQGKHSEALLLQQIALSICRKAVGDNHLITARQYHGLASCLSEQGKHAEALPNYQKGLAIRKNVLGEGHPATASSCNSVGFCLNAQGKHAEALPYFRKAMTIREKILGERHPDTASSYNNVAFCLEDLGKHSSAVPYYRSALSVRLKQLGEQHPDTATTLSNLASCYYGQGKLGEAARHWHKAIAGREQARLKSAGSGFERSLYRAGYLSPRAALAICLLHLDKPMEAWKQAEANLARGLLDDLPLAPGAKVDADERARLSQLEEALVPLLARENLTEAEIKKRDALVKEHRGLLAALAEDAAKRSRERVLPLESIWKQIPPDTAVVFWLDELGEHWGCVLRRGQSPEWIELPGSGAQAAWTSDDNTWSQRALAALADGNSDARELRKFLDALHRQRIAPLKPHLKGVRRLLVVPAGKMSAVPIEALTDRYLVSYVPSPSVYASRMQEHRPLDASSLLVLADPVFTRSAPQRPDPPTGGLLVKAILPNSLATKMRLACGDVLLEYDGKQVIKPDDLKSNADKERVVIKLWREGNSLTGRIPSGELGVVLDKRPIAKALLNWRKREREIQSIGRGGAWQALPGTRLEARTLAALLPKTKLLLGSDASEQKLADIASSGGLKKYRILHLATHGEANPEQPELSSLILSQDDLPTPEEAGKLALNAKPRIEGRLTVATVLKHWDLDADLVVLSACQTGLGKYITGEGMLGFTQALLQKGARSVVLSRWKVDDAATSLLMARFYQNLLGKRAGLKQPLKRAEALDEAKRWLRSLSRAEATKRLAKLVDGVPRGERGTIKAALPTRKPDIPQDNDRPFAHPYYWAAFVLIGDPN